MTFKIASIAALSLALMGGVALAEPDHAGAYRPPSPSDASDRSLRGDGGMVDLDLMETGSIRIGSLRIGTGSGASSGTGPACGESSRGGGGEPTSVDPNSPSVPNC